MGGVTSHLMLASVDSECAAAGVNTLMLAFGTRLMSLAIGVCNALPELARKAVDV